MKLNRGLLIVVGLVALVLAGAVTTVFLPSAQKWVVLRMAARQPGIRLELGEVSVGLSSFRASQVEFVKGGSVVRVADVSGEYSLSSLLARRVELHRLDVRGINVDLSRQSAKATAAAAAAPAAFAGLFAGLELPVDVQLERCEIDGRATLPGPAGRPAIQTEFNLTGGQFGSGREGSFVVNARLTNPQPRAVSVLRINATIRAAVSAQRAFQSIGLSAVVDAEGPALTEKTQLRIASRLAQSAAGRESYTAKIDTVAGGTATTVLDVNAEFAAAAKAIEGAWSFKANRSQVEPFFLGEPLPEFGAYGNGRFRFDTAARRVSLSGCHFSGVADQLGTIAPKLEPLGAVSLQADFDAAFGGAMARIDRLDLVLSAQRPVLEARTRRPLEIDLDKRTFRFEGGPGEVLALKLLGVPAVWAQPFLVAVPVKDGSLTGDIALIAEGDNLRARTTAPLKLSGLEFGGPTPPLTGKTDVVFGLEALAAPGNIQAALRDFRVVTSTGDTITAEAEVAVPAGAAPPINLKARFDADLPHLLAAQVPVNGLRVKGEADLTVQEGRVAIRAFTADIAANGVPLCTASALQPFTVDLTKRRATAADVARPELVRIVLGRVPLPAFAQGGDALAFGGRVMQGEFVVAIDGEKILVRSPIPLRLADLSLARPGQPQVRQLAAELNPTAEISATVIKVQTGATTLRTATGATILSAQADATLVPDQESRINATFQLDLPAMATQPVFAAAGIVSAGRMGGEVRAAIGPHGVTVEARTTLNGLVARATGQPLPVANLSLRAVVAPDGAMTVQAPLLLDSGGQRSDLNLTATVKPAGDNYTFDAKMTSSRLDVDDARAVFGVFASGAQTETPNANAPAAKSMAPVTGPAKADTSAVWSRVRGQAALDLQAVTYGKEWSMTGVRGLLTVDATRVILEKFAATFDAKSHLEARGELRFAAKTARPYQLDGKVVLTDFDTGRLFRAIEAKKTPTVEGLFTANGKLAGDGVNLGELAERVRGQFDLTSKKGIFRGLARTTSKVSSATKAVQLGAALGALLGSDSVARSAEKVAGTAYLVDELAASLGEFAYDQLSVKLSREEGLNVQLKEVSLISQEVRLVGSGLLTHAKGVPLLQQALSVELALAGRGKVQQVLDKLGALDGTRDDLGYAKMRVPVTIGGTLEKPDPAKFYAAFATSGLFNLIGR